MGVTHLAIDNLTIAYKDKKTATTTTLITQATAELVASKLTVLLGINGIGKSSLLRVLAGLQTDYSGTVSVLGKNIHSYSLAEKATYMSVVLTEKPTHSYLTVEEVIALGRQPHTNWTGKLTEIDERIIANSLKITQIEQLKNRYLHTLSDGQLQKTLIARALAQTSSIMLLDEPTAHLDICNKAEIWNVLKHIASHEQKSILLTSHDIDFSLQLADVIWLIHDKQLLTFTPIELLQSNLLNHVFKSSYFRFDHDKMVML